MSGMSAGNTMPTTRLDALTAAIRTDFLELTILGRGFDVCAHATGTPRR